MYGFNKNSMNYDTGTSFLEDCLNKNLKFNDIDYIKYIEHFGAASWGKNLNYTQFLNKNKQYL